MSVSDCKHAIDMGCKPKFRQSLIEHIQELAKTYNGVVSSMRFMLVGGGWQRSIADFIPGSINIGAKL